MGRATKAAMLAATMAFTLMGAPEGLAAQRAHARVSVTVVPVAFVHRIESPTVAAREAGFTEYSARLHVSANTRYSIAVELPGEDQAAVQVRDAAGRFRDLGAGASAVVSEGTAGEGIVEEVRYRVTGPSSDRPVALNFVMTHS